MMPGHIYLSTKMYAHPAIIQATSAAQLLWIRALCEMNRTTRDGTLPREVVRGLERELGTNIAATKSLLKQGLFVDCGDYYEIPKRAGIARAELYKLGPSGHRRPGISQRVREAIYSRDGYACLHCGSGERLSIDHIVPWSKGGAHHADNFQTLCMPCNMAKGARV
jgi:hypothetical protein